MCSGAKPIPWSHLQHCMLMAQQSLARQRPPVFLTILFQEEMIAAWFTPSSHRLMCTFVIPDVYFLDVFSSFLPNSLPCRHHSTYFPSKIKTLHPLCDQILSLFFFFRPPFQITALSGKCSPLSTCPRAAAYWRRSNCSRPGRGSPSAAC